MLPASSSSSKISNAGSPNDRISRIKNYSKFNPNEYLTLNLCETSLPTMTINDFWKKRLEERFSHQDSSKMLEEFMRTELFSKINQLIRERFQKSYIPENSSHVLNKELLTELSYKTILLDLFKERLYEIKKAFEQLSVAMEQRTSRGDEFREQIIVITDQKDFSSFSEAWEQVLKQNEKHFLLLKKCMGFAKTKNSDYLEVLNSWQSILCVNAREVLQFQEVNKDISGLIREKELRLADIDRIPLCDLKRSILGDSGRNLEISINNQATPDRNNSYFQGLIYQIHAALRLPVTDEEIAHVSKCLTNEKEIKSKFCSRLLRLCTINAWSHAVELIKTSKKGFSEIPFITKFQDGMMCEVTIFNRDKYEVSQTKKLIVYKRIKPSDKDCLIVDHNHPVCSITFRAKFRVENDHCNLAVEITDWSLNKDVEFQDKLLAYRILSNHVQNKQN